MPKPFVSTRNGLFNWAFSQFTCLQISKSLKHSSAATFPILISLMASAAFVQFLDPDSNVAPTVMYSSFLLLSFMDGSLSNHVVVSSTLVLLVLSTDRSSIRKAATLFTALLYLLTGIHKLNSGFFDPSHSCASLYVSGAFSSLPESLLVLEKFIQVLRFIVGLAPYGAVFFELGMPVLLVLTSLIFPSDRWLYRTILIGCFFHGILALPPSPLSVYPFSAIMVPLYILLLPESVKIEQYVSLLVSKLWVKGSVILGILLSHQYASFLLFDELSLFEYPDYGLWSTFFVWNCAWWCIIIRNYFLRHEPQGKTTVSNPLPRTSILVLTSLSLFAMSPYIGLRNYPALAMFSNLRLEGSNPNTWMPSYDLFGYMTDWIEIIDGGNPATSGIQFDLGEMFPSKLKRTNTKLGLSNEFYICPPRSISNPDLELSFEHFSVPSIEVRRVLSTKRHDPSNRTMIFNYIHHYKNGTIAKKCFNSDTVDETDNLIQPLSLFEKLFVRFRTFSEQYSPCRH